MYEVAHCGRCDPIQQLVSLKTKLVVYKECYLTKNLGGKNKSLILKSEHHTLKPIKGLILHC